MGGCGSVRGRRLTGRGGRDVRRGTSRSISLCILEVREDQDEEESEEEGTPSSYLCGSVGGWITNGDLSPSIACPYPQPRH